MFILASLILAQNPLRYDTPAIDPFLPEEIRPALVAAMAAEHDPKRGPGNAIELLKAEKLKFGAGTEAGAQGDRRAVALDLRIAALILRARYSKSTEFPPALRRQQAIGTYSRLDLTDPGLVEWIQLGLAELPEARTRWSKKTAPTIKASFLVRGDLDKKALQARFAALLQPLGVRMVVVPLAEADYVITVGAQDAPPPSPDQRAVRVNLSVERMVHGKVIWRQALYRTEAADEAPPALDAALTWLARIGGRDMFFRWLGEFSFPLLLGPPPGQEKGHEGHNHGKGH